MKLLLSWVREFVDVTAPADDIAEKLALRGFEVASIDHLRGEDAVIDFEVTANRPDCLSVIGLAREIGTVYDLAVRLPSAAPGSKVPLAALESGESDRVTVVLEDPELCPRYAAATADVTATTSPAWMVDRLQAAGVRAITPLVDVTNYVLMELGQPMHAFDLDALEGHELRIRRAHAGEAITTLDGVQRTLDGEMLAIADARRAQAVAGVIGGAESEVSSATRRVAFESAYFKPTSVRQTSKRLGMKTEASARFERGADINAPVVALQRAVALMHIIGAGRIAGPIVDRYPHFRGMKPLRLRRERLARVLGLRVPDVEVVRILRGLGLGATQTADGWDVAAPTYRVDLLREVDLIEEVGRHYGFDRLEAILPPMAASAEPPDVRITMDQTVRRVLTSAGLWEAVTFGIIESRAARAFAPGAPGTEEEQVIGIANPLSAKFDALRPSLLPGLLDAVAHNRRHGQRHVALFELGARFSKTDGETRAAALAWTGSATGEHWSGSDRAVDFFDVQGLVESLCAALGNRVRFQPSRASFLVPGKTAAVVSGETAVGLVGQLQPAAVEAAGAPRQDPIFVAELGLDALRSLSAPDNESVRPIPRYPSVVRDVSIVVSESLPAEIIRGTIRAAAEGQPAPLVAIAFFDRYQGKGVPAGSVSVSVRLTFRADDRTLTDREVQQAVDRILSSLGEAHGAVQR
jgi:phenylalanyl-tRNA synthetase beta chain